MIIPCLVQVYGPAQTSAMEMTPGSPIGAITSPPSAANISPGIVTTGWYRPFFVNNPYPHASFAQARVLWRPHHGIIRVVNVADGPSDFVQMGSDLVGTGSTNPTNDTINITTDFNAMVDTRVAGGRQIGFLFGDNGSDTFTLLGLGLEIFLDVPGVLPQ